MYTYIKNFENNLQCSRASSTFIILYYYKFIHIYLGKKKDFNTILELQNLPVVQTSRIRF